MALEFTIFIELSIGYGLTRHDKKWQGAESPGFKKLGLIFNFNFNKSLVY